MKHYKLMGFIMTALLSSGAYAQIGPDDLSKGFCTFHGQKIGFKQEPASYIRTYDAIISDELKAQMTIRIQSFSGYSYRLSLIHNGEFIVNNDGFASFEDDKVSTLKLVGSLRGEPVTCEVTTGVNMSGAAK